MKTKLKLGFFIILLFIIYGFIAPYLISKDDDIAVVLGIVVVFLGLLTVPSIVKLISKLLNK